MTGKLLTTTEAAERLGVSRVTINEWIDKGFFPNAYKLSGQAKSPYRIPVSDIETFEAKRLSESAA